MISKSKYTQLKGNMSNQIRGNMRSALGNSKSSLRRMIAPKKAVRTY